MDIVLKIAGVFVLVSLGIMFLTIACKFFSESERIDLQNELTKAGHQR